MSKISQRRVLKLETLCISSSSSFYLVRRLIGWFSVGKVQSLIKRVGARFKAHASVADWRRAYWPANASHIRAQARTTLKLEHLSII
jgi:hypothetical protein